MISDNISLTSVYCGTKPIHTLDKNDIPSVLTAADLNTNTSPSNAEVTYITRVDHIQAVNTLS